MNRSFTLFCISASVNSSLGGHLLTGCHLLFFSLPFSRFYCDYCDTYLTHDSVSSVSFQFRETVCLPFATTWIDLESIMLSEIRLSKKHILFYHLYVEPKNEAKQNRLTDTEKN